MITLYFFFNKYFINIYYLHIGLMIVTLVLNSFFSINTVINESNKNYSNSHNFTYIILVTFFSDLKRN